MAADEGRRVLNEIVTYWTLEGSDDVGEDGRIVFDGGEGVVRTEEAVDLGCVGWTMVDVVGTVATWRF